MIFTKENKKDFKKSKKFYLCDKNIAHFEMDRMRDHCHFTGKFRGAACQLCNMNKLRKPVIFHNLSGYDAHLFIRELSSVNEVKNEKITCIPNTEEHIIVDTFKIKKKNIGIKFEIRFIDSFKFMASSLEKLVSNLKDFEITSKYFDEMKLIRKGVYPYDFMDSPKKFNYKLPITSSDALPLSYRRLMAIKWPLIGKAIKLHVGSCDKHLAYCLDLNVEVWAYAQWKKKCDGIC